MDENGIKSLTKLFKDQDQVKEKSSIFIPVNKDCRGYTNCFKCTECGANIYTADYSRWLEYRFCPYCGEAD